ncbi:MAG: PilZ domain-containing protein [Amphritea sp.]
MPDTETMDKLPPIESGAVLQVSDAGGSVKYVSRFVGQDGGVIITRLPPISLISKSAKGAEDLTYRDTFYKKRKLVVRLISNGHIFAFETEVIDLFLQGSKLMISSYPKQVQSRMLREEPRYPCTLPSQLTVGELSVTGVLINFSLNGGLFQLTEDVDQAAFVQAKKDDQDLVLKVQLPFDEQPEELTGKLMSVPNNERQLGVSFISGKEKIQRYISSLKLDTISTHF